MPRSRLLALLALLFLPLLVFHRPLLLGEAFVPADLLSYLSPWKSLHPPTEESPAWNVLRFDGITQFYPWRIEATRQVQAGQLPVWNAHQFAANGGTPLLANSQSAPLYPLHVLFYLAPLRYIWYIFGLVSAIHLLIAAGGLYVLLRACGLRRGVCVFGAATWTLSAPIICWLSLPSFLGVACWLPWLLLLIRVAHTEAGTRTGRLAILGAGGVAGTLILAGHLQIALYALLAALLYAAFWGVVVLRSGRVLVPRWLGGVVLATILAVGFAAPQVLPAIALSRISHRAVTEKTTALYDANNGSAVPPRSFVTFLVPDFYGHPNHGLHWNNSNLRDASGRSGNNYAEWALYTGILPLLLAIFAVSTRRFGAPPPPELGAGGALPNYPDKIFFTILALLALLIATGTPLNLVLFYAVPGYASLANPGRVLTVFVLAVSALAAFGLQALLDPAIPAPAKRRGAFVALAVSLLLAAWGASLGATWARSAVAQVSFGELLTQALPGFLLAGILMPLSAALLFVLPRFAGNPERARAALALCFLLTVADLALWGYGYNPSAKPERVFPVTPGIAWLQENAPDAPIAVINRDWTLGQSPPQYAALPPNTLTVYGLHDISGYDSLFPKAAKEQITVAGEGEDASPPANGNMVFVKRIQTALNLGAEYIVLAGDAPIPENDLPESYRGDDLVILRGGERGTGSGAPTKPSPPPMPESLQVGLYLSAAAATVFLAALLTILRAKRAPSTKPD
ncbi:MAG: hypothetical protein H8F28_21120 [Fibrella sp.]|nr:hypothetical protein [Armatimonadota bacterium]